MSFYALLFDMALILVGSFGIGAGSNFYVGIGVFIVAIGLYGRSR